jgi:hypothetical protein
MTGIGWRVAGGVLAIASVAWTGVTVAGLVAHEERTSVTAYDAAGITVIDVDSSAGSVKIIGSSGRPEITVSARISNGLRATSEEQRVVDGRLELRASCPVLGSEWCAVDYAIEVPADLDVRVDADNGSVEVADVAGDVTLTSDNGRVTGTGLRSDAVTADSDNGSVTMELLEPPASVEARSDNGSVDVVLPRTAESYKLSIGTDNGDVSDDIRTDPASAREITIDSDNGDATVRYAP